MAAPGHPAPSSGMGVPQPLLWVRQGNQAEIQDPGCCRVASDARVCAARRGTGTLTPARPCRESCRHRCTRKGGLPGGQRDAAVCWALSGPRGTGAYKTPPGPSRAGGTEPPLRCFPRKPRPLPGSGSADLQLPPDPRPPPPRNACLRKQSSPGALGTWRLRSTPDRFP